MEVSVSFRVDQIKTGVQLNDDQELIATFQFQSKVHPADIARVLNLQKTRVPMTCTISSNQAELDLRIQQVDKNGEVDDVGVRILDVGTK
jgi:hypothetical protein